MTDATYTILIRRRDDGAYTFELLAPNGAPLARRLRIPDRIDIAAADEYLRRRLAEDELAAPC